MSRSRSKPVLSLALLGAAAVARGEAILDVSGAVVASAPRLEVQVVVRNRGDRAAAAIEIAGELFGQQRHARLGGAVAPGASGSLVMEFDPSTARPGLHALTLLLEHPLEGAPDAAGNPPLASQRAWLPIVLGARPDPAVRLAAKPARIDVRSWLEVSIESADGAPHLVRLRALPARGLRAEPETVDAEVPATGTVQTRLGLMRAGAPRGTRHGVLLVAESRDGSLARTAVVTAPVDVVPDPAFLPRLHRPLLVLAVLLLALVLGVEAWLARARQS